LGIGGGLFSLVAESNDDALTGCGCPPDGNGNIALEYHVVSDDARQSHIGAA